MFQYKRYNYGWALKIWRFGFRLNNQENYRVFSIEWLKPHFRYYGGK